MFKGFHTACKVRLRFLSYNYHMLITSKMNPHRSSSCIQAVEKFVVAKTGLNPGLQSSWLPQILNAVASSPAGFANFEKNSELEKYDGHALLGLLIPANSTMTSQKVFLRLLHERSQWYVYAEKSWSAEPSIRNATRRVRGASGKWDARGEDVYRGYREQTPAPSLYARSLQSLSRRLDHITGTAIEPIIPSVPWGRHDAFGDRERGPHC